MILSVLLSRLLFCLFVHIRSISSLSANGDVRLIGRKNNSVLIEGTLQVFLNYTWGTVCYRGFNIYAAHAACRELGYIKAKYYGIADDMGYPTVDVTVPIFLTNVNCPTVSNPILSGQLHLLRCQYDGNADCYHTDDVGVVCENVPLIRSPYNTQVWLKPKHPSTTITQSSGLLHIYLNGQWDLVCYEEFNKFSADSVCLQNGYTNALRFEDSDMTSPQDISFRNVNCHMMESCLYKCLNYSAISNQLNNCHSRLVVVVSCEFNQSYSNSIPGNLVTCNGELLYDSRNVSKVVGITVALFLAFFILIIIVIITCAVLTCCPLSVLRRRNYRAIV